MDQAKVNGVKMYLDPSTNRIIYELPQNLDGETLMKWKESNKGAISSFKSTHNPNASKKKKKKK